MLELRITCESADEARVYLNAHQYHNLLSDIQLAFRNAQKYGDEAALAASAKKFYPDICQAVENSTGAY